MIFRKPNVVHPGQWVTYKDKAALVIGRQGGAYRLQPCGTAETCVVQRSEFKRRSANARGI